MNQRRCCVATHTMTVIVWRHLMTIQLVPMRSMVFVKKSMTRSPERCGISFSQLQLPFYQGENFLPPAQVGVGIGEPGSIMSNKGIKTCHQLQIVLSFCQSPELQVSPSQVESISKALVLLHGFESVENGVLDVVVLIKSEGSLQANGQRRIRIHLLQFIQCTRQQFNTRSAVMHVQKLSRHSQRICNLAPRSLQHQQVHCVQRRHRQKRMTQAKKKRAMQL